LFGVCRGIADYFDFSVFWIRAMVYVLAALLMKSDPARSGARKSKPMAASRHRCTRSETAERLRRKWKHLEKRIRNMEDKVTSREFDWNNRFHG
jgi:phage shock protein C